MEDYENNDEYNENNDEYNEKEACSREHHVTPQEGVDVINKFICAAYARNSDSAALYEVQSITPYWINTYDRVED